MITAGSANPLLLGPEGYQVGRSVRLRSSAGGNFSRTPASAGNRTTWTLSAWVKRGTLGITQALFGTSTGGAAPNFEFRFNSADVLDVYDNSGAVQWRLVTTQVFRDPSAWYHIVLAFDSTNATSTNRAKLYVNGSQVTAFSTATYPSASYASYWNSTLAAGIGLSVGDQFDGYLTEVNFIDGQALTPSSFGETNPVTGVWQPKKYGGTYGTNGFYLNFSDPSAATAAAIGKDYSGNGNNWTPNNISVTAGVTYDSMLDVPTPWADGGNGRGNYAVLNPLQFAVAPTAGNLDFASGGGEACPKATIQLPLTGKWYWETYCSQTGTDNYIGVTTNQTGLSFSGTYRGYRKTGVKDTNGTTSAYGASWASGDTLAVAVDMDAGTIVFYKNGTSQGTAFSDLAGTAWTIFFYGYIAAGHQVNFGQRPFTYTPPTGFKALNTQNLPDSTIVKGNKYFDTLLWTSTASIQTVSGSAFQPDLVWVKSRASASANEGYHHVVDSVRGVCSVGGTLYTNTTDAASWIGTNNSVTAFNSNGFSSGVADGLNGNAMVSWLWKKGATQGFDIVTYTGDGGTNKALAHSLGATPAFAIIKSRTNAAGVPDWQIYHKSISPTYRLYFTTSAQVAASGMWGSSAWNSSNIYVGWDGANYGTNYSGSTYVAYLFAEVAGFSKFGSYVGNGSADGPFVYCGFRPRYVMIKKTDTAGDSWFVFDTAREQFNVQGNWLAPNLSNAEATNTFADILSNGFKLRGSISAFNGSGGTYIFAAFAENPFKNSLAR